VDYIAAQVDFPEIDVRLSLTVRRGYWVSGIYVPAGSALIGETIAHTFPSEKDINVLTLYRGQKVIQNLRYERQLGSEDRLFFGENRFNACDDR
jgi:ribosomal protein S6--L-glutamate ligase